MEIRRTPSVRPAGISGVGATPPPASAAIPRPSAGLSSFDPGPVQIDPLPTPPAAQAQAAQKSGGEEAKKPTDEEKELSKQLDKMIMESFTEEMQKSGEKLIQSMKEEG